MRLQTLNVQLKACPAQSSQGYAVDCGVKVVDRSNDSIWQTFRTRRMKEDLMGMPLPSARSLSYPLALYIVLGQTPARRAHAVRCPPMVQASVNEVATVDPQSTGGNAAGNEDAERRTTSAQEDPPEEEYGDDDFEDEQPREENTGLGAIWGHRGRPCACKGTTPCCTTPHSTKALAIKELFPLWLGETRVCPGVGRL